jgi:hypothetical protein
LVAGNIESGTLISPFGDGFIANVLDGAEVTLSDAAASLLNGVAGTCLSAGCIDFGTRIPILPASAAAADGPRLYHLADELGEETAVAGNIESGTRRSPFAFLATWGATSGAALVAGGESVAIAADSFGPGSIESGTLSDVSRLATGNRAGDGPPGATATGREISATTGAGVGVIDSGNLIVVSGVVVTIGVCCS